MKYFWMVASALVLNLSISCLSLATQIVDGIIATVGSEIVLQSELEELKHQLRMPGLAEAMYGKKLDKVPSDAEILDMLIEDKLIEETVREMGVEIAETEVESTITQIASKNHVNKQELINMLKQEGVDYNKYKDNIRSRLKKDRFKAQFITPYVTVSDDQVRRHLEQGMSSLAMLDTTFVVLAPDEVKEWQSLNNAAERLKKMSVTTFKGPPTPYSAYLQDFAPKLAQDLKGKKKGYVTPVLEMDGRFVLVKIDQIRKGHREDSSQYQEKFQEAKSKILQEAYKKYMDRWVKQRKHNVDIKFLTLPKSS